jgi:hypothetical protein
MNQGTQGYRLTKETKGRKSRETVPLSSQKLFLRSALILSSHKFFTYELQECYCTFSFSLLKNCNEVTVTVYQ